MKRFSEMAYRECLAEFHAACRLPVDPAAAALVAGWLRPSFERILDHPDGLRRWADHGQRMRDNARHLGGFADFFASHAETGLVGAEELSRALEIVRADCTVRAARTPVAYEYCEEVPVNAAPAAAFLKAGTPTSEVA